MDSQELKDLLMKEIAGIRQAVDAKGARRLDLDMLARIVSRVGELSGECEECNNFLKELEVYVRRIKDSSGLPDKAHFKAYNSLKSTITAHLQKKHKLVTEGYYTGIYMSIGLALGLPFGQLFGNLAIGIPIGMCIGIAIGASMDANAKKKGLVI